MTRPRYTPRLSWWPVVPVRWRIQAEGGRHAYGLEPRKTWRLFLFGVLPIASLPRPLFRERDA